MKSRFSDKQLVEFYLEAHDYPTSNINYIHAIRWIKAWYEVELSATVVVRLLRSFGAEVG